MFIHVTRYAYEQREMKRITINFAKILILKRKNIQFTNVILFGRLFNSSLYLQKLSKTCIKNKFACMTFPTIVIT